MRIILALLLAFALLPSCASLENVQIPTVEKISRFQFGELRDGKLAFSFYTDLRNPDKLKFRIKKVDLDILLNNHKIAEIHSNRTIRIRRLLNPEIKWELTGDLRELIRPGNILGVLLGKKPDIVVKGELVVARFPIRKTIPVNLKVPVELPKF